LDILDSNLIYGHQAVPAGKSYVRPAELLAEMDRLGIAECWCSDRRAIENYPPIGNARLCEEISDHDRLHPVWVVLPPATGEMGKPEDLLSAMKDNGVGLVRSHPDAHGYVPADWCCGELWTALEKHRVPVLLESQHWGELDEMMRVHPDLPVILVGVGYRANRLLYPLLDRHPMLRVETSTYLTNEGLREITARFGSERLIYGSGSPDICPEEALGTLEYSGLDDEDKQAIACGNLRTLLAGSEL